MSGPTMEKSQGRVAAILLTPRVFPSLPQAASTPLLPPTAPLQPAQRARELPTTKLLQESRQPLQMERQAVHGQ